MRLIRFTGAALVAALVVATATAVGDGSGKKVTCTSHLQNVAVPGATTGEQFGTVHCGHGFGKGVQHNPSVTVKPTSATTATGTGPFQQFFDTGTISGTFKATSTGSVTYAGTAKISDGTGAYEDVRGFAKFECNSQDGGIHATCTEKMTLADS
jgi:hypothetical protein